jgi:hypothetical protein
MATKDLFSQMLNQKPVQAPALQGASVKIQKPPGTSEFAYLGNSPYRHPMENRGNDIAGSAWVRMLGNKTKGIKP